MPDVERFFFWLMYEVRQKRLQRLLHHLFVLGRETAQCSGHIINSGVNPPICARAVFHDIVSSSGRVALVWWCDVFLFDQRLVL